MVYFFKKQEAFTIFFRVPISYTHKKKKREKKDSNRTNKRTSQQPRKGEKLFSLSDQEQSMSQTGQNSWKWVSWNMRYENFMPPKQRKKNNCCLDDFSEHETVPSLALRLVEPVGALCFFKMLWWLKREDCFFLRKKWCHILLL